MQALSHPFPSRPWKTIHLSGSDREMGRQHAEQLKDECARGMPKFYHDLMARLLHRQPPRWTDRAFLGIAKKAIDPFLVDKLLKSVPSHCRERLEGMAEGSGMDRRELLIALVLPDLLPVVQSALCAVFPTKFVDPLPAMRMGCSSFLSSGDRFLIGRNLDFPGVSYWDRYPVLQSCTPQKGLRSISFTTAGVPLGGITGINEAQVFVALHQHYCKSASLTGTLPFILGEKILSEARTLDEARAILETAKHASGWAFIVADGKSRQGMIWETTPRASGVRTLEGANVLAHSNYYQTAACRPNEYSASARMNWDNYWRKSRLEELVRKAGDNLSPQQGCLALSDHFDPYWEEEKPTNRVVSQLYNIQSLVIDPETMQAWCAEGDSPIHLAKFRRFDLGKVFAGGSGETEEALNAFRFGDEKKDRAKREFVRGFVYAMDGEEGRALEHVERALQAHFTPEIAQTGAVLLMKQGEFSRAEEWLQKSAALIEDKLQKRASHKPPPEYFEIRLFLGRVKDLLGKTAEAKSIYLSLSKHIDLEDTNLRKIATRGRTYRQRDLDKILLPFSSYVSFS